MFQPDADRGVPTCGNKVTKPGAVSRIGVIPRTLFGSQPSEQRDVAAAVVIETFSARHSPASRRSSKTAMVSIPTIMPQ
jgi:hypothetical protein